MSRVKRIWEVRGYVCNCLQGRRGEEREEGGHAMASAISYTTAKGIHNLSSVVTCAAFIRCTTFALAEGLVSSAIT